MGIECLAGSENAVSSDKHGISIFTAHGKREKDVYANYRPSVRYSSDIGTFAVCII